MMALMILTDGGDNMGKTNAAGIRRTRSTANQRDDSPVLAELPSDLLPLSIREAATLMGLHYMRVRTLIHAGDLSSFHIGRRLYTNARLVREFLEQAGTTGGKQSA